MQTRPSDEEQGSVENLLAPGQKPVAFPRPFWIAGIGLVMLGATIGLFWLS